jgi:hypothetical protein
MGLVSYRPDIGYVDGMANLAYTLLSELNDEYTAF